VFRVGGATPGAAVGAVAAIRIVVAALSANADLRFATSSAHER